MLEEKMFVENFVIAMVVVPLIILYAYGMFNIVKLCFTLIDKFFDALEWRINDWIYRFKRGNDL